ncbi:MAG: efflux RND transporter periplasmic adaptor subunit [Spirochaetales bacterium]|nr:efflux RND transporter periplasmic adaptor subunit [Spirochaetales bacterium]
MKTHMILPVLTLFLLISCNQGKDGAAGAGAMQNPGENSETVFAVNTVQAVKGEILDYIEVNGDVVTRTSVDIFADTMGKLTSLSIRLGDYVEKGAVIAEVDPSKPGMKFVASPVKSPIAGTIISINVQVGATITPQTPVAKISRMDEIQVRTEVAERYISKIREGLDALLRFEAYPDERFRATIKELSPVVDPVTRTMEVRLGFDDYDKRIRVGMFAEVKIITEKKRGIVKIPSECLIRRYGGYYVFIVTDGVVEKRKVTPGLQIDNKLEITTGLKPGELVVIQGQTLLEDQAKVKIVEEREPLPQSDIIE